MSEPQTTTTQRSFAGKLFHWLFSWRILRRGLMALAVLITLIALLWTEENWRGKRDWEKYKSEWEAKGERFDLASFTPKPVPPEQNFYATPFLAPLLDYEIVNGEAQWRDSNGVARAKSLGVVGGALVDLEQGDLKGAQQYLGSNTNFPANPKRKDPARDVLFALQKFDPILAELRVASERPAAVYSIHPEHDLGAQMVMFGVMKTMAQTAYLHALANLEAGNSADAMADVRFMFRLGQALRGEPMLISHLVRIAILNIALQPVRQGLAKHRWSDAQLQELQGMLLSDDLLADYGRMMRGERAFGNELMGQNIAGNFGAMDRQNAGFKFLAVFSPRGLLYQNQIAINRTHEQTTLRAVDAVAHRVYPERCNTNAFMAALGRRTPYNVLGWMLFPAFQKVFGRFAYTQNGFDQAAIACALERHRLARGQFPESLEALVPQFMEKIPGDIIGGQPLHYRRTDDPPSQGSGAASGKFVLYSIGWNEKDDGGVAARNKDGKEDLENGDWVWRYPAK
jgi:hypothetical protein